MNLAAAGPLICIWLHWRASRRRDELADAAGRRLAWLSLWSLVAGTVLGGGLLGVSLVAEPKYFSVLAGFGAHKLWFLLAELGCSLLWTGLYAALWNRAKRYSPAHATVALLSITNLLYHFPPMMSAVALVDTRPAMAEEITAMTAIGWLQVPEILSRSVHVWLASLAVSGLALAILAMQRSAAATDADRRLAAAGARIALVPTVFQLLVGMWVLLTLPRRAAGGLMGGDLPATTLLCVSVLLSLLLLHLLGAIAMGEVTRQSVTRCALVMLLVVLCMSAVLRRVRHLGKSDLARMAVVADSLRAPSRNQPDGLFNFDRSSLGLESIAS